MDWIRQMMGFSDKLRSDDAYRNPTWEEIFDNRNFNNRPQPPEGNHENFHYGGTTYSFSMGDMEDMEDNFSSAFGQMDDMFRQLDSIMQNFHGHPGGHMIITDAPEHENTNEPQSPRDSFLKNPDSGSPTEKSSQPPSFPHHRPPLFGPSFSDPDQHTQDGGHGPGGHFGGFHDHNMRDPFSMMEDLFKGFGGAFDMNPFGMHPGVPMLPEAGSPENPRESVVKKEDTDLDDRITGNFSELLKERPRYDPPIIPGQPSLSSPEGLQQPQAPRVTQRYHSTSIVRIRKPDGSVEETRKYTDSTGREEVTVTQSQPEDGSNPGSLLRQDDQDIMNRHSAHGHSLPSLFSWFFTR